MEFTLSADEANQRLDHYLTARLPELSRSRIQALIREGAVLVEGVAARPSERLKAGQKITVTLPETPAVEGVQPEEIALDILFEDADCLVLNKPAGLVVHPAAGNLAGTLVNGLLHHCGELSGIGGDDRPGIVHRLDKETSGVMVVARNDRAHEALSAQFAAREVTKIYLAVAWGHFRRKRGVVEAPIARHRVHRKKMAVSAPGEGREARTGYRVLQELEWESGGKREPASLVECTLYTGRTHQIRVHLQHLGHPLVGDRVYGRGGGALRQLLHAWKLGFRHPTTGEKLEFVAAIPDDFPPLP